VVSVAMIYPQELAVLQGKGFGDSKLFSGQTSEFANTARLEHLLQSLLRRRAVRSVVTLGFEWWLWRDTATTVV
jgi:hypothetical protein